MLNASVIGGAGLVQERLVRLAAEDRGIDFQPVFKDVRTALGEWWDEQMSSLTAEFGALDAKLESIVLRHALSNGPAVDSRFAVVRNVAIRLPASCADEVPTGCSSRAGVSMNPTESPLPVHDGSGCDTCIINQTGLMKSSFTETESTNSASEVAKQIQEHRHSECEPARPTAKSRLFRSMSLEEEPGSWAWLVVHHPTFHVFVTFLILANAVFVGWGLEKQARYKWCRAAAEDLERPAACEDWDGIYLVGTISFNVVFVLEVFVRVCASPLHFFFGKGHRWNCFDFGLAGCALAELTSDVGSITYVRLVRVLRTLHVLQVVRVITSFQILRRMVSSLLNSLSSLLWLIVLLVLILYVFALAFVQAGVQGSRVSSATEEAFRRMHGSVPTSMLTLFESITGGMDWAEAMHPLFDIHPFYGFIFIIFIVVNVFAVMNVVNGVFVNQALEIAQFDRDLVVQERVSEAQRSVRAFEHFFSRRFQSAGGITDRDSLIACLRDDPESLASLQMLGIDCSEECLQELVAHFDFRGGQIDVTDFVRCCQRVQGPAKSIDLLDLRSRVEELTEQLRALGVGGLQKRRPLPDLSKLPHKLPDGTFAISEFRRSQSNGPGVPSISGVMSRFAHSGPVGIR